MAIKILIFVLISLVFTAGFLWGQELQIQPENQDTEIVTKIPYEGRYYFIKIVPTDRTPSIPMPIYNPDAQMDYRIPDSLRFIDPDSLWQFIPESTPDSDGE